MLGFFKNLIILSKLFSLKLYLFINNFFNLSNCGIFNTNSFLDILICLGLLKYSLASLYLKFSGNLYLLSIIFLLFNINSSILLTHQHLIIFGGFNYQPIII